ncbi:MAG TPA: ABC transporter permease [Bryobacteraceae bacterium]|nr:ABC transporter permease [Bryobacteraceae bacterium]
MNNLRYAVRLLAKSPGFTTIAVLTLALGIGVNSGIFTIVDAVILRALPYPDPDRIVSVWEVSTGRGPQAATNSGGNIGASTPSRTTVSPANLADYGRDATAFAAISGVELTGMNLTGDGPPERVFGERANADYFAVLGVQPATGRAFLPEEDRPGDRHVVVIAHELWQRRLGSDPTIVGRSVTLDGESYRVVGIMPSGFQPPSQFANVTRIEFVIPAAYSTVELTQHGSHTVDVIARLKPGVTIGQARAQLNATSSRLAKAYPSTNQNVKAELGPLADDIARNVRTSVLILFGAVGLILLIACANLANLLLARAVGRRREITIRVALGASRARIIGELLTQALLLAGLGCAAGLMVGVWTKALLLKFAPAGIPRIENAALDVRVVLFTLALSLATGILVGLFPALHVSRARPAESLRSTERGLAPSGVLRWRSVLMAGEIAISMVLLVGAGLLLRSFILVSGIDLGFETEHVIAMNVNLPETRYVTADQRFAFFDDLANRVTALPGVQSVAFCNRMPMRGGWSGSLRIDTDPTDRNADLQAVNPGYFRTLGMPLVRGRELTQADRAGAPRVAVVNLAFVHQFFPGQDAVGHQIRRNQNSPLVTIVGVVGDIHRGGKAAPMNPQVYFPAAQTDLYPVRLADFAFRASGDPKLLVAGVEQQVWAIDRDQPVTNVRTLQEVVSQGVAQRRFQMLLLVSFAALALVLALVGVYGVISYGVSQRTGELGLRIALGASRRDILGMVIVQGMTLVIAGIAVGAGAAYGLSRYLTTLLFQIKPADPLTYGALALLLSAIALAACYLPARRATRVDPMVALRYE